MAEQKKKGFAAFEERIHEMEEEDRKRESAPEGQGTDQGAARGSPQTGEEKGRTKK